MQPVGGKTPCPLRTPLRHLANANKNSEVTNCGRRR